MESELVLPCSNFIQVGKLKSKLRWISFVREKHVLLWKAMLHWDHTLPDYLTLAFDCCWAVSSASSEEN